MLELATAMVRLLEAVGAFTFIAVPLVQRGPGRPPIGDDPQSVLAHPRRRLIYEMIEERPGISAIEIQKALTLGGGVLDNHLDRLRQADLLETRRSGRFIRLYPAGKAPLENDPDLLPDMTKAVAEAVLQEPGRTSTEISEDLQIPKQRVNAHLRLLAHMGLVKAVADSKDGRQVRHKPTGLLGGTVNRWKRRN